MNYKLHPTMQVLLASHGNPKVACYSNPFEACVTYDFDLSFNPYKPSLAEEKDGVKEKHLVSIELADERIHVKLLTVENRILINQLALEYSATTTEVFKALMFCLGKWNVRCNSDRQEIEALAEQQN